REGRQHPGRQAGDRAQPHPPGPGPAPGGPGASQAAPGDPGGAAPSAGQLRAGRAGVSHLGDRLSALIDGELGHTQRERVLAHLARCEPCRREAVALRALKQRMHALGEATADVALTARLVAMGARYPAPGAALSRRRWPMRSIAAAFLTVAGLGLPAAALMAGGGGDAQPGPGVTPAV